MAGFIRDSPNSTLASSKRFVISEEDYSRLVPFGNVEYLIEFRLHDLSALSAFETAYSATGLPANGPALTWPLFQDTLLESIRLNLGSGTKHAPVLLLGFLGAVIVFLLILLYVNGSLRRFRSISAVQAIRFGAQADTAHRSGAIRLSSNRVFSSNFILGLKDVLSRKRLYATMLAVVILAGFIMIVPRICTLPFPAMISSHTLEWETAICAWISSRPRKLADIGSYMENDSEIADYALFVSKIFPVRLDNGETEKLKVELRDHTVFPLQYAQDRLSAAAISSLGAAAFRLPSIP